MAVITEPEQMGNSVTFTFSSEFQGPCLYLREIPGHLFEERERKGRTTVFLRDITGNDLKASAVQHPTRPTPVANPLRQSLDEKERCSGCKIQIL